MEEETKNFNSTILNKRAITDESSDNPQAKKVRLCFSGQEFRNQLKTEGRIDALQEFFSLINEESKENHILAYLDNGGTPLEILQTMENDPNVSQVLVFEITNEILLQINAKFRKYQTVAYESCKYLLSIYITQINKMMGLSSSMKERLAALKLLTTVATFSVVLAKDILLHVNFNPSNLELLTKVVEGKNEVRNAFIHFIIAFLVDGHFPTLSVLLEKRGLMTSIINGLKYDVADTVVLVLTAMKNHILENPFVSKTVKMKTFNTPVVKDIVNLYNWKGPDAMPDPKKKNKVVTVDEIEKSKVSEAVHGFLLVLCTSHKFGVIFKDYSIGIGKKQQNSLMYTVLECLERPWEHSYAKELVLKVCKACPDLTKTMWTNIKPFLEPRPTMKWLNTIKFACELIEELQPDCLEYCVSSLNAHQLNHIISILVAPFPILKTIIPENRTFDKITVKHNILLLLSTMTHAILNYLNKAKNWPNIDHVMLKKSIANSLTRNFPDVELILANWEQTDEESSDFINCTTCDYLETAIDLLQDYKILIPQMLDDISPVFDIKIFLSKSDNLKMRMIQIKAVLLFLDLEPALFNPKTEIFNITLQMSIEYYFEGKNMIALQVLNKLLSISGIFDGYAEEVDFWIDGFLNLKKYDSDVTLFFQHLIKRADENAVEYNRKLFELNGANFSILLLALTDYLCEKEVSKSIKMYLNFVILNLLHLQNNFDAFDQIIEQLAFLPYELMDYTQKWMKGQSVILTSIKGPLLIEFVQFSYNFLEGVKIENIDFDLYHNFKLNLLQMAMFYLANLIKNGLLKENHMQISKELVTILFNKNVFDDDRYITTILKNSSLLQTFNLFDSNDYSSNFILEFIEKLTQAGHTDIGKFLVEYRRKSVSVITKALREPHKYTDAVSVKILEILELHYDDCVNLIKKFVDCSDTKNFFKVACYCLNRIAALAKNNFDFEPLTNEIVQKLSKTFVVLIKTQTTDLHLFSAALLNYLKIFMHNLEGVDVELFDNLLKIEEYNKDNLQLCEFLLARKSNFIKCLEDNLDIICAKKGFILSLLPPVIEQNNEILLENIFEKIQISIVKALEKPHKAGQHFHNHYQSVGVLIEKFMKIDKFADEIHKFETSELFHVHMIKKVYDKIEKNDKQAGNMLMTFIHLLIILLKQKRGGKATLHLSEIGQIFVDLLKNFDKNLDLSRLATNETFKIFVKLSLKFGVGEEVVLVKILSYLVEICVSQEEDAKLILDMLLSHSQFLDVILENSSKVELLDLWFILISKWPQFMEKSHVPVLLSAYRATKTESDIIILKLLKTYESDPDQTKFHDFKPFLWGRAAASHYSIRSDVQNVLWRQPKMGDVLDNLHHATIMATITDPSSPNSYDLNYFLPLFSHLLSPENPVYTYKFTKSGALALTITGLRGDKSQRLATCHVLSRFYFHLEGRQTGKDNLLWMRLVEAICKGIVNLPDLQINNFVGVFLARTALILAQPVHVMYVPLTQYLTVQDALNFSTIPELYTFLHSSHVNSKDHKHFILEVLRDGLKTDKDFTTYLRSMSFKLISELCSSTVCHLDTKILILDVFKACCRLPLGIKILCGNMSFLAQIFSFFIHHFHSKFKECDEVVTKLLEILLTIVEVDIDKHRNFQIYFNLMMIAEDEVFYNHVKGDILDVFYQILVIIIRRFPTYISKDNVENLVCRSEDKFCRYLMKYGCNFCKETDFTNNLTKLLCIKFK